MLPSYLDGPHRPRTRHRAASPLLLRVVVAASALAIVVVSALLLH